MAQITAGVAFKYGTMGAGKTKPSEWIHIPGVSEIPEIGGDVETIETTSLDNLEYKTYLPSLKDTGGALGLTAMDSRELRAAWKGFVEASNTENGAAACIEIPAPLSKRIWFPAKAINMAFGGASVNAALTTTAYFTVLDDPIEEDIEA